MPEIQKIRYTHDAVIDEIIANPAISQGELAARFGYTQAWMSIIVNSDAFQERLAERKAQLIDPKLQATIEDRLDGLARRALDKLLDRLDNGTPISNKDLLSMATLGVGDKNKRPSGPVSQQNLYVVQLPPPAPSAQSWVQTAQGRGASLVIENEPEKPPEESSNLLPLNS